MPAPFRREARADRERLPVRAVRERSEWSVIPGSGLPSCSKVRVSKSEARLDAPTASVLPSGLTAIQGTEVGAPVLVAVQDPDHRLRALEVGEQVAAGLRRVVDRDRLAGEQEREVEVLLDERLSAEALGELGRFGVACLAALDDGEDPSGDGRDEQDRDSREQHAKAPVRASGALRLLLGGLAALGDELPLELVEVERVIGGPVERGGETGAAVELAPIARRRVPLGRRLGDVAAKPASFGVLLDPLAQARPFAQQRLVGDLDGALRRR